MGAQIGRLHCQSGPDRNRAFIGVSVAASDPLAGFTWSARLQTHIPDSNTPLGTTAVDDFDAIPSWSDELSVSGAEVVQADEAKQPFLLYEDGVPTFISDAVDDLLAGAFASLSGLTARSVFVVFKRDDTGGTNLVSVHNGSNAWAVNIQPWNDGKLYDTVGANSFADFAFASSAWVVVSSIYSGAGATNADRLKMYVDGVQKVLAFSGDAIPATLPVTNALNICSSAITAGTLDGGVIAVLIAPTAFSDPNRVIIENYLASLIP